MIDLLWVTALMMWIGSIILFSDFTFSPHPFKWWWWKNKDTTLMSVYIISIILMVGLPFLLILMSNKL
jgi:hypothetical protein